MALLNYGRQVMIGLSRSPQVVGFGYLLTKKIHHLYSCHIHKNPNNNNLKSGRQIIGSTTHNYIKTSQSRGFFTFLFGKTDPAHDPALANFAELLGKLKSCPIKNHNLDEIKPLLKELLGSVSHRTTVKFLHELAKPSSPFIRRDSDDSDNNVKDIVNKLPTKIIPFFQDIMVETVEDRYQRLLDQGISCSSRTKSVCVTADVSPLRDYTLKAFVVGDHVMIAERDYIPFSSDNLHMVTLPRFPYRYDKVTTCMVRDKLNIIFPRLHDSAVVNIPKIFQVYIWHRGSGELTETLEGHSGAVNRGWQTLL